MNKKSAKILIIVEGARTDLLLMKKVLNLYGISENHQIVSYNTSIYDLYERMFFENDPGSLDLLQVLKEHEKDEKKKKLFDEHYSDVILIFDLDPQAARYSPEAISKMADFFNESSDNGKLYINYPMVESFYHMKTIPDSNYLSYTVSLDELAKGAYKSRVKSICRIPYRRFASSREECNTVIHQNLEKACFLTGMSETEVPTNTGSILSAQLAFLQQQNLLSVLCTCVFYIFDYNPSLINLQDNSTDE